MRTRLSLVVLAGLLAGAAAAWLAAGAGPHRPTEPGPVLTVLVGASLIGSGLGAWHARPDNAVGRVMVFTGFAWFASLLTEASSPLLYTVGDLVQYLWIAGFICLLLCFPSGRLQGTIDRVLVVATVVLAVGVELVAMLYGNKVGLRCSECPNNLLHAFANNTRALRLLDLQRIGGAVVALTTIAVVGARWWRASAPQRRAVTPVLVAGTLTLLALTATIVDDLIGNPLGSLPAKVFFYMTATVPVAVLVVFVQRRLARGQVAGLVVQLGEPTASADLRSALARALGDPGLELAYWYPAEARYVRADGRHVELPGDGDDRRSTFVERDGQPIAVLLHDPALEHNAELVESVCAAAGLALENERLHAELRARLVELQASRARLVEATDAERRRIERDLHDGTQQRLVSIAMSLGLLESKLPAEPAAAAPIVRQTRDALAVALEELRELTHGILPPLLAERGLPAGLEELARRAALPTHLQIELEGRLPDRVESAAYFFASEALANAVKHSHGSEVRIAAVRQGAVLTVEVADDGIGGAASGGGSGLRGLTDRVEAAGGRLTLSSPVGRGTTLRAEIPCA
jgi:signal transduction histidine kinase